MSDDVCFEKENVVANDTKSATTWCGWRESNPHAHTDTSTSSLPVYQFQHSREIRLKFESQGLLYLLWLDLSTAFFTEEAKPRPGGVRASPPPRPGVRRALRYCG